MNDHLKKTLEQIGEDFRQAISEDSRHYCEVSIGRRAERLGYPDLKKQFRDVYALVPLKRPEATRFPLVSRTSNRGGSPRRPLRSTP